MDVARIFDGLNSEQRRAVEAVRGPVCILAGAGSGKTTTITRRIANQVATRAFAATEILAVTFTDKAAREMRERLAELDAGRVPARTFHSAALAQLHHFTDGQVADVLPSKAPILQPLAQALPRPYRFRPVRDLATEIEWAKNRRLTPESYLDGLEDHAPPIPPDLMGRVFRRYEERKRAQGRIDFEDVLALAIRLYDEDETALARFRDRYRAFTVDEYQDVNLLQQSLLERWLGERSDLCVVGDDYQSIYSFTGATPRYLLELPRRIPGCAVARLEENYRSTPEILAFANRLVPRMGGARKVLRTIRASGPEPEVHVFSDRASEVWFVVDQARTLHERGVRYEDIAVLYRINARSEEFEEALARAEIPYQVRGGAFLRRPAARQTLRMLGRVAVETQVAEAVRRAAERQGFTEEVAPGVGDEEAARQADLARLIRLAEEFEGQGTVGAFVADLEARFAAETAGRGVNLLTYHRAKGLEFEAVFLPRLEEGELPFGRSLGGAAVAEERRLLYVGLTRAKTRLYLTRAAGQRPSRFLGELDARAPTAAGSLRKPRSGTDAAAPHVLAALKVWRLERARADRVPAYVVFHDRTLAQIAARAPRTRGEIAAVPGVGPVKLERYGDEVLAALRDAL